MFVVVKSCSSKNYRYIYISVRLFLGCSGMVTNVPWMWFSNPWCRLLLHFLSLFFSACRFVGCIVGGHLCNLRPAAGSRHGSHHLTSCQCCCIQCCEEGGWRKEIFIKCCKTQNVENGFATRNNKHKTQKKVTKPQNDQRETVCF